MEREGTGGRAEEEGALERMAGEEVVGLVSLEPRGGPKT